jgi:hypothetical protein
LWATTLGLRDQREAERYLDWYILNPPLYCYNILKSTAIPKRKSSVPVRILLDF